MSSSAHRQIVISKETRTTVTSQGHSQQKDNRKSVCAQMQSNRVQIKHTKNIFSPAANTGNVAFFFFFSGDVSVELTSKFHFFVH